MPNKFHNVDNGSPSIFSPGKSRATQKKLALRPFFSFNGVLQWVKPGFFFIDTRCIPYFQRSGKRIVHLLYQLGLAGFQSAKLHQSTCESQGATIHGINGRGTALVVNGTEM